MLNEMKDIIAEYHNIKRDIIYENENEEYDPLSSESNNLFYHLSAFLKFYIDDGILIADFDLMKQLIRYIINEGPRFGYHLNRKKKRGLTYLVIAITTI